MSGRYGGVKGVVMEGREDALPGFVVQLVISTFLFAPHLIAQGEL